MQNKKQRFHAGTSLWIYGTNVGKNCKNSDQNIFLSMATCLFSDDYGHRFIENHVNNPTWYKNLQFNGFMHF